MNATPTGGFRAVTTSLRTHGGKGVQRVDDASPAK
jgi:hypothetical protein